MLMELRGSRELFSKVILKSEGVVDREIGRNWVLDELNLTKFCLPQPEILSRSELRDIEWSERDVERS